MGAFIHLLRAFSLIWYCLSPSYREKCHARWQKTPKHRVVLEVGGGLVGLTVLIGLAIMIYSGLNSSGPH